MCNFLHDAPSVNQSGENPRPSRPVMLLLLLSTDQREGDAAGTAHASPGGSDHVTRRSSGSGRGRYCRGGGEDAGLGHWNFAPLKFCVFRFDDFCFVRPFDMKRRTHTLTHTHTYTRKHTRTDTQHTYTAHTHTRAQTHTTHTPHTHTHTHQFLHQDPDLLTKFELTADIQRHKYWHRDGQADRQTDRQTDRHTHTHTSRAPD